MGVYTATKLGIIDAVYRLMRLLASRGLFTQRRGGRFALAPTGEALRIDAFDSIRGYVLFAGDPMHWEHWGQLSHSVRTGRCAIEEVRGKPTFEWFQDVPELAAAFNDGMASISKMQTPVVVSAYDFSQFGTIVDVGGGHGLLLSAILRRATNSRGNSVRRRIGGRRRAGCSRVRRSIGSMRRHRRIIFRVGARGR